jgi:hypothetical protein
MVLAHEYMGPPRFAPFGLARGGRGRAKGGESDRYLGVRIIKSIGTVIT